MKPHLFITTALIAAAAATAVADTTVTETYGSGTLNTAIPDNDPVLTPFLISVTGSKIASLTEVAVSFELRGTAADAGWAGDIFALLLQSPVGETPDLDDPGAVLLNQVGVTGGNLAGFGYDGWTVTLRDSGATDIHDESLVSGVLSGTFQPDGRLSPLDTERPSLLSVFLGCTGNGDWRFNVADLSGGGTMQLVSWSVELTGEPITNAVPEASTWAAAAGLAVLAAAAWRRSRR